jgi:hypothetical protein
MEAEEEVVLEALVGMMKVVMMEEVVEVAEVVVLEALVGMTEKMIL